MRDQTRVGKKLLYSLSSLLARDGNLKIGLQPFPEFLFINKTPDGEVFGCGDPETNQDITMYIESAGLSERHADIKF